MVDKVKQKEGISNNEADELISKLKKLISKDKDPQYIELSETEIKKICISAIDVFDKESSLVDAKAPVYVVGDIHGQFSDLMRLFRCCGYPDASKFVFLGDYVDRGKQSLETIMLLFLFKIKYPNNICLLRGNHECSSINKIYGFYDEMKKRVSVKAWKNICDVFLYMPFSALIENKIFCMHGGLGPDLERIDQARLLKKPSEIPDDGIACDLLWADPSDEIVGDFGFNERGVSVTFSSEYTKYFLEENDLDLICRGHQVVEEGYEFFADQNLVTIFTAPNYTGEFDNNGSVMYLDANLICSFNILKSKIKLTESKESKKEKMKKYKSIN